MGAESKTRMTEGSISKKIILFAIPLFLGNLFQQLYNTADSLIVGNYLGSNALAAVSSSGNLIFLMVGFINGIAMGAGVVIARYYGAKNKDYLQRAIHTTTAFGLVAGITLTAAGMYLAPKILVLMNTGRCTSGIDSIFSNLFCRFSGCSHVQYFRWNPAVGGGRPPSADLSDYFLLCECGAGYLLYRRTWHGSGIGSSGNGYIPVCQRDSLYGASDAGEGRLPAGA